MKRSFFPSLPALVVVTLASLAGPLPAAPAAPFEAAGTYTVTDTQGRLFETALGGRAAPGGPFSGRTLNRWVRPGVVEGTASFTFASGSLLIAYLVERDDETGMFAGTYVVTGGTGAFAGVSSGGDILIDPDETGGGEFALRGTIDR
jgi:hypothetical protein